MPVKLFVGGLSFSTSTDRLREAFARFGGVTSAAVMTDRETGRSRGFGFVEMASPEEAEQAIAGLNGFSLDGRTIRVDKATPRGAGGPRPAFTDRRSGPGRPPSGPRGGFGDRPSGGGGAGPGRGGFGDRSAPGRGPRPGGGGGMPGDDRATAREPRRTSFGNAGRGQGQGDRRGPGGQREQKRPSSLKKGPGAQRRSEDRGRRSLGDETGGGYRPF